MHHTKLHHQISILSLVIVLILTSGGWAIDQDVELAKKRYDDPKGYFYVVPPSGWSIQEYPDDVRGKVAFLASKSNIDFRILVNAVDFSSINELLNFCRRAEKQLGVPMNVEKFDFYGQEAVQRSFEIKGIKFLYIDFLVGKVSHNLAYGSPPGLYDQYLPVVLKSMETYEPVFKETGSSESLTHLVARKLRLANLMLANDRADLALEYVRDGLIDAPENKELLKLKQEVDMKFKKTEKQKSTMGTKKYVSKKFRLNCEVPEKVNIYTTIDPGPMQSRINSGTPLWLVNSVLASERINLKVSDYEDATESELNQFKQELDKGTPYRSMSKYKKISVNYVKIGKNGDKHAIEHIHSLEQKVPKKLRQIMFIHRGRFFSFTCATSPERYEIADKEFFDLIFNTLEFE